MTKKSEIELQTARRKDYSVEDTDWIRTFLNGAVFGTLAFVDGDLPYLNSNCFAYIEEQDIIYFHTAIAGRTRDILSRNDKCCFTAVEVGRFLPAQEALNFSVEYKAVMVFGRAAILDSDDDKRTALEAILDKYAPHLHRGRDYNDITKGELDATTVYRIDIESWSAKQKQVAPDFPGAFSYPVDGDD